MYAENSPKSMMVTLDGYMMFDFKIPAKPPGNAGCVSDLVLTDLSLNPKPPTIFHTYSYDDWGYKNRDRNHWTNSTKDFIKKEKRNGLPVAYTRVSHKIKIKKSSVY